MTQVTARRVGARGPRDFLALCDRARRSAAEVLQGLLNLSCFVHDLVNRNFYFYMSESRARYLRATLACFLA